MNTIVVIIGVVLIYIGIIIIIVTKKNNYILPSILIGVGVLSIIGTYINDRRNKLLTDFTKRRGSLIYELDRDNILGRRPDV